jgi:hypothetical protein
MKDERDRHDDRENGTNGEDKKGEYSAQSFSPLFGKLFSSPSFFIFISPFVTNPGGFLSLLDSPVPAHDELDTAE